MKLNRILSGIPAAAVLLTGCAAPDGGVCSERNYAADGAVAEAAAPDGVIHVLGLEAPAGARRRAAAPGAKMAVAKEKGGSSNFSAVEGRQVAFSATLRISSPDVAQALRKANEITREFGGYASLINDRACTLKIPVKNAEAALAALEKIGTVSSREIVAEDVTDTAFDLDMRIANLEKLHQKLTALVDKAVDVKNILAVENELSRVTGELERLKATRLNLQRRVDFVTFRIYFSASAAVEVKARRLLLPETTRLGLWNDNYSVRTDELPDAPFELKLPKGFIPVRMNGYDGFFAMDDQDTLLAATSFEQLEGADLEFWQSAIARALRELRGYEITTEIRTAPDGEKYIVFKGERLRGKTPMRYEASCRIEKHLFGADEVHIVEILGTRERMEQLDLAALHDSVE